jgi:hypothetical protein
MSESNKELDVALNKLDVRYRTEDFLKRIGASDEAASLLATHPDTVAKFKWNGVVLSFNGSDLPAIDDEAAKTHFLGGPFARLFTTADSGDKPGGDDSAQIDPAILARARAGNKTAYGQLWRHFNGDVKRLNAVLTPEGDGHDNFSNGHDPTSTKNPFSKLRDPRTGKIDPAIEKQVASMVRSLGTKKTAEIAAAVGKTISGLPLRGH